MLNQPQIFPFIQEKALEFIIQLVATLVDDKETPDHHKTFGCVNLVPGIIDLMVTQS